MKYIFFLLPLFFLSAEAQMKKQNNKFVKTPGGKIIGTPGSTTTAKVYDTILVASTYGITPANTSNHTQWNALVSAVNGLPRTLRKKVYFNLPQGSVLNMAAQIEMPQTDSLDIDFNYSLIKSTRTTNSADWALHSSDNYGKYRIFNHEPSARFTGGTISANIDSGATSFFTSPANATTIQVGDIIEISTKKNLPFQDISPTRATQGAIKKVVWKNNTTGEVGVHSPFYHFGTLSTATDSLRLRAYRPSHNWTIENLRMELFAGSMGECLNLQKMTNLTIKNSTFDGKAIVRAPTGTYPYGSQDSYFGVAVGGVGITVQDCRSQNFWCKTFTFGYAFNALGENITFIRDTAEHSKHGFTGSSPQISAFINVFDSYTVDANVEVHPECFFSTFRNVTVTEVGFSTYGDGIWHRAFHGKSVSCKVYRASTIHPELVGSTSTGIAQAQSGAGGWFQICDSNEVYGAFSYAINFGNNASDDSSYNVKIRYNKTEGSTQRGISTKKADAVEIIGNEVTTVGSGIFIEGGRDNLIDGNIVNFGGTGIYIAQNTFRLPWLNNTMTNNVLNRQSGTGPGIRLQNGYDYVFVLNNTINGGIIQYNELLNYTRLQIQNNPGSSVNVNVSPP